MWIEVRNCGWYYWIRTRPHVNPLFSLTRVDGKPRFVVDRHLLRRSLLFIGEVHSWILTRTGNLAPTHHHFSSTRHPLFCFLKKKRDPLGDSLMDPSEYWKDWKVRGVSIEREKNGLISLVSATLDPRNSPSSRVLSLHIGDRRPVFFGVWRSFFFFLGSCSSCSCMLCPVRK